MVKAPNFKFKNSLGGDMHSQEHVLVVIVIIVVVIITGIMFNTLH